MPTDVDKVLDALKERLKAVNDAELARKLRVDKSTVSSWRSRGRVPSRYVEILDGASKQFVQAPPVKWSLHEEIAHSLALFKFTHIAKDVVTSEDYRTNLDFFSSQAWFWLLMSNCLHELVNFMDESGHDIHTAFAVLIHEYLDGKRSIENEKDHYEKYMSFVAKQP